ncbi:MAG: hypothetical protein C0621_07965 [Desulfuromonas sp.]|nr:MAG: hypothetical protein C0621_07965 [Desulfuromonas sp.]
MISPERVNAYIFHISGGQVIFIKNQLLGRTDSDHCFYHLGCSEPFQASFDHVVNKNLRGEGCGCTNCE